MQTTPRWGTRYPNADGVGEVADVPLWLSRLATDLDDVAKDDQGALSARPAAGKRGRYYYATDQLRLYRDTGSAWVEIEMRNLYWGQEIPAEITMSANANGTGSTNLSLGGPSVTITLPSRSWVEVMAEADALGPGGSSPTAGYQAYGQINVNGTSLQTMNPVAGDFGAYLFATFTYNPAFTGSSNLNTNSLMGGRWIGKTMEAGTYTIEFRYTAMVPGAVGAQSAKFKNRKLFVRAEPLG